MRIQNLKHGPLAIDSLALDFAQPTSFLGANASGKTILATLLAGEETPDSGLIRNRPASVAYLSFESQQHDYEAEIAKDETDFLDRIDYGTTGFEILEQSGATSTEIHALASRFKLEPLLHRGFRQFSSGELRMLTLLKEVLRKTELLILDEPFESLDTANTNKFQTFLEELVVSGQHLLTFANAIADVPPWTKRLIVLHRGTIVADASAESLRSDPSLEHLLGVGRNTTPSLPASLSTEQTPVPNPLIQLRNGRVAYGETIQFHHLDWILRPGEHTLVTGPNGSGKSTLLSLITGAHPQCYTNDLTVFGYLRGSGESIWDIKRNIGLVSPALHRDYRVSASVETVVLSGFFDSIGLYDRPSASQHTAAGDWLDIFGLAHHAHAPFRSLSFGQQRLVLIARALVKHPPLLILDEPTSGLDALNRSLVLAALENLASLRHTTLLVVSHRQDERLTLFQRQLLFEPDSSGESRFTISQLPLNGKAHNNFP